jgi:hypothetical protein
MAKLSCSTSPLQKIAQRATDRASPQSRRSNRPSCNPRLAFKNLVTVVPAFLRKNFRREQIFVQVKFFERFLLHVKNPAAVKNLHFASVQASRGQKFEHNLNWRNEHRLA